MKLDTIPALNPRAMTAPQNGLSAGTLATYLRDIVEFPEAWRHLIRYDSAAPVRTPIRVFTHHCPPEGLRLYLTSWPPGYTTPVHGHDSTTRVAALLVGELTELVCTPSGVTEQRLRHNQILVLEAEWPHSLSNPGATYTVSIHAYVAGQAEHTFLSGPPL